MPGLRRSSVFEIPRHGALKAKRFGATKAADHKLPYGISRHSKHEAYVIWRRRVESESEYAAWNGAKDCLYVSYYLPLASGYAIRPSGLFSCRYLTSPSVLAWHAHHPESLQFGSSALTNICAALEVESVQADVCSHQAQPPGTPAGAMVEKCDTCKSTSRTCKSQPSQELSRRSVSLGLLKFITFLSCWAHGQPAPMFRAGGACLTLSPGRHWFFMEAGNRDGGKSTPT